ncbi:MAG: hypothetical protein ACTSX7_19755 [Alphaproteobacteria bacterium]
MSNAVSAETDDAPSDQLSESPPTNWRLAAAAGDDKVAKALESVTDVGALATSYAALRSAVSTGKFANKIVLPDGDAPAEDWARFRAALPEHMRAPEAPSGYSLQHPEWMGGGDANMDPGVQENLDEFVAAMHGAGATEAQVQTALDHHYELVARGKASQEVADAHYLQESEAALRREWGQGYERNMALASRATGTLFGGDSDVANLELKNGILLGSLPSFARGMAQVGRLMGEDPMIGIESGGGRDLQGQIDVITATGMQDGDYYSDAVQQKLRPLYEQLHGTSPGSTRV